MSTCDNCGRTCNPLVRFCNQLCANAYYKKHPKDLIKCELCGKLSIEGSPCIGDLLHDNTD